MSDILCPNCCEPWDTYFLRHDLPYEAATDEKDCAFVKNVLDNRECILKYSDYRARLKEAGWTFSGDRSMLFIKTCGCCKANNRDKFLSVRALQMDDLEAIIGHDEDGAQSELEEWSSYE